MLRVDELEVDRFEVLAIGQMAESTRVVTESDVVLFAAITGDLNPVHVDIDHASTSSFGQRIVHGMLTAGHLSALMAMQLPGPSAVYLSQSLQFVRPVHIGDAITSRVEVIELIEAKRQVRLATSCRNQRGKVVLEGEALILVAKGP